MSRQTRSGGDGGIRGAWRWRLLVNCGAVSNQPFQKPRPGFVRAGRRWRLLLSCGAVPHEALGWAEVRIRTNQSHTHGDWGGRGEGGILLPAPVSAQAPVRGAPFGVEQIRKRGPLSVFPSGGRGGTSPAADG
jgi:hypothetical protein